jgi:DNA modification methylase
MLEIDKIYEGHTLDVLKRLPDESVDTIFTSPPYYKLRSYGNQKTLWGCDPDCRHEFVSEDSYNDQLRYRAGHNAQVGNAKNPAIYISKKSGSDNGKNEWQRLL